MGSASTPDEPQQPRRPHLGFGGTPQAWMLEDRPPAKER
jgi:hypothetical protein